MSKGSSQHTDRKHIERKHREKTDRKHTEIFRTSQFICMHACPGRKMVPATCHGCKFMVLANNILELLLSWWSSLAGSAKFWNSSFVTFWSLLDFTGEILVDLLCGLDWACRGLNFGTPFCKAHGQDCSFSPP